jgi:cellulose synthase/poly-beta-1,6-N-acetylglucosamine synthase-like glycosyltransferase
VHTQPGTVVLTFDGGPDPQWTPRLLDRLAQHHVKATFFLVGTRVNQYPELVRRMLDEGHEVGVQSFSDADLWTLPPWLRALEIRLAANAIAGATGHRTALFRPPFLRPAEELTSVEAAVLREAGEAGYLCVLSNVEAVVTVDGLDALERLVAQGKRYTTVTEAIGAPSALAPAPWDMRLSGALLSTAQSIAAVAAVVVTIMLAAALALAVLRIALQLIAAGRWREPEGRVRDPVSVIVPAYNEAANIAATVLSLACSRYPWVEVIVVDDGSTDGTAAIARSLGLRRVRVITQRNAGKPAALNAGIRAARGKLVVLVDGDTVFHPDTIRHLVQGFCDPTVGAIAGNAKVANKNSLLGKWQHVEYATYSNLDRRLFDLAGCMTTIPGAIGAYRADVLRQVGGVPSDTLAEDTDLTMTVLQAGWRVIYEPEAVAWTEAPSSLRQLWRQRYRWSYGIMQAAWKHRHATGPLARRGLPYLVLYQILFPLIAPTVDVFSLYGLVFLPWYQVTLAFGSLLTLQMLSAAVALRLDGESLRPLWTFPLQQLVYRQLTYLVVLQSMVTALGGNRLRWHRIRRTGSAAELLARS